MSKNVVAFRARRARGNANAVRRSAAGLSSPMARAFGAALGIAVFMLGGQSALGYSRFISELNWNTFPSNWTTSTSDATVIFGPNDGFSAQEYAPSTLGIQLNANTLATDTMRLGSASFIGKNSNGLQSIGAAGTYTFNWSLVVPTGAEGTASFAWGNGSGDSHSFTIGSSLTPGTFTGSFSQTLALGDEFSFILEGIVNKGNPVVFNTMLMASPLTPVPDASNSGVTLAFASLALMAGPWVCLRRRDRLTSFAVGNFAQLTRTIT